MNAGTPRSRPRRQSQDPLARAAVACNRCRGRKTKCLGIVPYPCMSCENSGAECIYPDQPKRIFVSEKEWNDLQARAEAADLASSSSAGPISPSPSTDAPDNEDDWWYRNREVLIVRHRAVGAASSTYLATQLNPASRGNVAFDVSPLKHATLPLRRDMDTVLPDLPPLDTAKRWYTAQYAYIGSIFAFIQPKYFEERLTEVYSRSLDTTIREDCLLYCQILLILAFGQMYSLNEWASTDGPPGFTYFQAAMKLLPDLHEEGSVLFVEVLGLVSYFMQILNRRDAAFLYVGLAVRMAISLGMHQEVNNSTMDAVELEHRRRVWWSTYSMDRILCVKSGNPISIHDEDTDAAWPSPLAELDLDPAQPRILSHYSQLSRILGKIGDTIYRKRHLSGTTLLSSVQNIMNDLEVWLTAIPPELKLDFPTLHNRVSREAVSTFLHYYQCVNMTGRPLLFRVCQKRLEALASCSASATWQEGLSSNIIHVVSNSIAAARTATSVMDAAAKHQLLATYGFMDGEHAFSAALVLVMANVAFPYNERDAESMELALSVLQGMANKGNEYIRARHALLINLRSALTRQIRSRRGVTSGQLSDVSDPASIARTSQPCDRVEEESPRGPTFSQIDDLSFNIDMQDADADAFWGEFLGNTQIGMNSQWIESAFQNEDSAQFEKASRT